MIEGKSILNSFSLLGIFKIVEKLYFLLVTSFQFLEVSIHSDEKMPLRRKLDFFLINFSNWELNNLSIKYKFFCFTQNSHKMCLGCFQILSIDVANLDFHNDIALSSLELPYSWTSFNYIIGGRMLMWMDSLSQKDHI